MILPTDFASNIFHLNGAPLNISPDSMKHLYPIYNKPSNAILLKFGRQTHKSTTIGYKISLPCLKYDNFHSLYVAPTGTQMSVFSTDKLDGALNGSPVVKDHFFNTKTKNQISYKEFTNGSKIYLRSAFHTADSIRGISADQMCIDEVQDMVSDHLSVIESCMNHSLAKWEGLQKRIPNLPMHLFSSKIYAGTPKTIENTMERFWDKSTQNEWIIKCRNSGCEKYNYINENNIGDTCMICNKCGKPIHYENGQWISMSPGAFIESYRLPQIVCNWINNKNNPQCWKINVINARATYTTEKFFNEILALPYASARHPLSVPEMMACCQQYDMIKEDDVDTSPLIKQAGMLTAGIDWGKGDLLSAGTSFSMLTIGGFIRGRFKTLFMKRYMGRECEPIGQVNDMLRIIRKFKVNLTIADTGDGRTSNAMMVEGLGAMKFAELFEHGTMKQKIKWDKTTGHYTINRTRVITDIMMEIKRAQVDFFKHEQFKDFQHDFTGIYTEYSERTRQMIMDHATPDDAFHSYMFSRIAMSILRGEYASYLTGGMNED